MNYVPLAYRAQMPGSDLSGIGRSLKRLKKKAVRIVKKTGVAKLAGGTMFLPVVAAMGAMKKGGGSGGSASEPASLLEQPAEATPPTTFDTMQAMMPQSFQAPMDAAQSFQAPTESVDATLEPDDSALPAGIAPSDGINPLVIVGVAAAAAAVLHLVTRKRR